MYVVYSMLALIPRSGDYSGALLDMRFLTIWVRLFHRISSSFVIS